MGEIINNNFFCINNIKNNYKCKDDINNCNENYRKHIFLCL